MSRQCSLLDLPRSSYYYQSATTDETTLALLRLVDEEYTRHPFLGTRKMEKFLQSLGYKVNRKRVQRLYRLLGIEAIYCRPNTSKANPEHKIFPYLLRNINIIEPNQVYCSDITYIRLRNGFMYLVAIMDWYSRYVLGWSLSPSLEAEFCIELLEEVLGKQTCDIFNTDQGSQFTSNNFIGILQSNAIKISMDGRGRALDNVFIERLWRSLKYECIYLQEFFNVQDLNKNLHCYFDYYNNSRMHQGLNYKTPAQIYYAR